MTKGTYFEIVRSKLNGVILNYFEGHFPRFEYQLEVFEKLLKTEKVKSVFDIGTGFPFTSGMFSFEKIPVTYGMLDAGWSPMNDCCIPMIVNVNYHPAIGTADLVICTECLEHLPSNMIAARDWLLSCVNPGGYLFLSFPLGGINAKDYDKENLASYDQTYSPHFREFTRETAREFIKDLPCEVVGEKEIFTRAYGNNIWNVLLKRID
jgi:hypothetical protein